MIVTHTNPDLDNIFATWLLRRFCGFGSEEITFCGVDDKHIDLANDSILVDVGGGEFDHHHIKKFISASSLVAEKYDLFKDRVISKLTDIVTKVDHGVFDEETTKISSFIDIIDGLNRLYESKPSIVIEISHTCLDALYIQWKNVENADNELEKAIQFETQWGKGIGIETRNNKLRWISHKKGIPIYIFVDPGTGFRGYCGIGGQGIDFSEQFRKISQIEPEADWYLHLTNDLLLCGSKKTKPKRLSTLSLNQLIEIIKID